MAMPSTILWTILGGGCLFRLGAEFFLREGPKGMA